ncbi:hypothetical protein ADK90_19500 [Streptomyces sp. XY413]|nr:hypothetical protein ADK90_19500 [Streptomyces sp. XY413]
MRAAVAPPLPATPSDARTAELVGALDPAFLSLVGWDWDLGVFFYPRAHPVLGIGECDVVGCDKGFERTGPLCSGCRLRWNKSGLSLEESLGAATRYTAQHVTQSLCRFPACGRPWRSPTAGLCGPRWVRSNGTASPAADPSDISTASTAACAGAV